MNIIVKPYESNLCYCRPDTTWEKESRDLYIPEGVDKVLWAPVVYAKICKAGKCVSPKFVTRYYDAVGFGTLTYCDDADIAFSSCMDHSSLMPVPCLNPSVLENGEGTFVISAGTENMHINADKKMQQTLEEAICKASERVSLRIGDIVAIELTDLKVLAERQEGEADLKAEYNGNCLFDLKVIF